MIPARDKSSTHRVVRAQGGPGGRTSIPDDELKNARHLLDYSSMFKQRICVKLADEHYEAFLKNYLIERGVKRYARVPFQYNGEVYYHFNKMEDVQTLFDGLREGALVSAKAISGSIEVEQTDADE